MDDRSSIRARAESWSRVACAALARTYPFEAGHQSLDSADVDVTPQRLHPAFHGSFDWHSSVHMQWTLVRLLTVAASEVHAGAISLLNERLCDTAIATEHDYLRARPAFERPYGWAWVCALAAAVHDCPLPEARIWSVALVRLVDEIADLTSAWLKRQTLPTRHGLQGNSAFALLTFLEALEKLGRLDQAMEVRAKALVWFGGDANFDTRFEPSGTDVFSPALSEAELMRRVLPASEFASWFTTFLPGFGVDRHLHLLEPPPVYDGPDGSLTHLSGLALSRAWQLRTLASSWPEGSPMAERLHAGASCQVQVALPLLTDGDFMSTHWLITFGMLAELLI